MNTYLKFSWIPSLMVIVGLTVISSCKDDEKPKAGISFAVAEGEANESEGTIEVKINLDRAPSSKVVLAYSLDGTADEGENADYEVLPDGGYITIEAGETEATVEIELHEDLDLEVEVDGSNLLTTETIILSLTEVVSGPAELGELTVYTLTVYEDDLYIEVSWDVGTGNAEDVDLDILVWIDDPEDDPDEGFLLWSQDVVGGRSGSNEFEAAIVVGGLPDGEYAFSFPYYSGTSDDLNFTVFYLNFGGTVNGSQETEKTGHYTLANLNPYDTETGTQPHLAQTMEKVGVNILNLSDIDVPGTGSRIKTFSGKIDPANMKRGESVKLKFDPKLLK